MDPKLVTPILMVAVVAWAVYRRVRRTIGRQPYQPKRMQVRIGFLAFVGLIMLVFSLRNVELAGAALAGIAAGAALGFFGLRHTKFENTPQGQFYTPHLYIGLFVTVLFLGRLAYRFIYLYPTLHAAAQSNESPFASFQKSPLTMAIFGIVIGYYVAYYAGVIREMRRASALASVTSADAENNPT
ncbi:MAG: DUF1453 domain-containing protein [Rudaea sp.]